MVSVQPAEASNWSAARAELIVEAKRPLKVGELHGILKIISFTACLCLHSSHQCHLSFFLYPRQAQLAAELSACNSDEESADVRARFEAAERDLEHSIGECCIIFSTSKCYAFTPTSNIPMHVQISASTSLCPVQTTSRLRPTSRWRCSTSSVRFYSRFKSNAATFPTFTKTHTHITHARFDSLVFPLYSLQVGTHAFNHSNKHYCA